MAARLEEAPGSVVTQRDRIIHPDVHSREKEPGCGTSGEPGAAWEAPTQHRGHHREGKDPKGDTERGKEKVTPISVQKSTERHPQRWAGNKSQKHSQKHNQ